jgi:sec-independent protein translocase protein TatA
VFDGLFQPMHLLVVLGIALLFFGPKRLPELGKGLGESIRKFRTGLKDDSLEMPAQQVESGSEAAGKA